MTKLHLVYIMYERARARIQAKQVQDSNINRVFMSVLANFALKYLILDIAPLYECGFLGAGANDLLDAAYKKTLVDLRADMIGLVELLPEASHPSTIGNEYGDIYENQFDTAINSRMNNSSGQVPELYHTHIKPVMKLGKQIAKL